MLLHFRRLSAPKHRPSHLQNPSYLKTRIDTAIQDASAHFRTNKKGNDCQAQVQYILTKLINPNGPTPNAVPCTPAYWIVTNETPIKFEGHTLLVAGYLTEDPTEARTAPEISETTSFDMTNPMVKEYPTLYEKTELTLFCLPNKTSIDDPIKKQYGLGEMPHEFAVIEIGLWGGARGHSVMYIYEKKEDAITAYFCDPSENFVSESSTEFFSRYKDAYPYVAFKSLYQERREGSPTVQIKEELDNPTPKKRPYDDELQESPPKRRVQAPVNRNRGNFGDDPLGLLEDVSVKHPDGRTTTGLSGDIGNGKPGLVNQVVKRKTDGSTLKGLWGDIGNGNLGFVGKVVQTYPDGTTLTGNWGDIGNGKRGFVGEVVQRLQNGYTLTGNWGDIGNGKRGFVGQVDLRLQNGSTLTGNWGDIGDGQRGFVGEVVQRLKNGSTLTGNWGDIGDGNRGSYGTVRIKHVDGSSLIGNFGDIGDGKRGLKGNVVRINTDGSTRRGVWDNDQYDFVGVVVQTNKDRTTLTGEWGNIPNGKRGFVGEVVKRFTNGITLTGEWGDIGKYQRNFVGEVVQRLLDGTTITGHWRYVGYGEYGFVRKTLPPS